MTYQWAEQTVCIALGDALEIAAELFVHRRNILGAGDYVLGHLWTDLETFRHHWPRLTN